ncbi:hypothetical protein OJF2_43290 [Aquisphaera giovannonii]|uniref:Uncharacterized protein n=1 Tax=Aquisphaera giovannonii TaxID=406548 RepID=A0A5B9W581_9BACT|nr:hypothetical protein [Aquisphaera giovannonii]QEH35772.1 hypothetical protein OJF2_43290 [Aquisphaera giovannonii]
MNRTAPDPLDEDEARLRDLVVEAGDPSVAARPEYLADLRRTVLDRLGPPRRTRRTTPWLIGSGLAAASVAACLALAFVLLRPANAWAQVARAIREQSWLHGRHVGPDGKVLSEAWFSPPTRAMASRSDRAIEYHDPARRTVTRFVPADGTIYLLPESSELVNASMDFYRALMDPSGSTRSPIPGTEVASQVRRKVEDGGRTWEDVELTLRLVGGPGQLRLRFRLDPATGLPHSATLTGADGPPRTTLFDYPDRGPADVYELGAPRTAKVVDRTPGADLEAILAGLKAGRVGFDDYRGVMTQVPGVGLRAIWRKGRKWRVESLFPTARSPQPVPRDADGAWWTEHLDQFTRVVQAICDGDKVYYYRLEGDLSMGDGQPPRVSLNMSQAINASDDPFMPWPDSFPEHLSHPNVWLPTEERTFSVEPKPDDGPAGTIRVRVSDIRFPGPARPDLYKIWVDPAKGYVAMKVETAILESLNPPKVAYIDAHVVEDLARAPGGAWYPTRVRRLTSNPKSEQASRFDLDFRTPIPDDLFRPLK